MCFLLSQFPLALRISCLKVLSKCVFCKRLNHPHSSLQRMTFFLSAASHSVWLGITLPLYGTISKRLCALVLFCFWFRFCFARLLLPSASNSTFWKHVIAKTKAQLPLALKSFRFISFISFHFMSGFVFVWRFRLLKLLACTPPKNRIEQKATKTYFSVYFALKFFLKLLLAFWHFAVGVVVFFFFCFVLKTLLTQNLSVHFQLSMAEHRILQTRTAKLAVLFEN